MKFSGLDVEVPVPVRPFVTSGVLVMTRLEGYKVRFLSILALILIKCVELVDVYALIYRLSVLIYCMSQVTDRAALDVMSVDKDALVSRIAHCIARQLLCYGVFNGINVLDSS